MNDDDIAELLDSVYEENTIEELLDEACMMKKLRRFFEFRDSVLREIILAAQIMKALRGERMPLWAQTMQNH